MGTPVAAHVYTLRPKQGYIETVVPQSLLTLRLMADLNVPGALTYCPEDFAWPSLQTGSSPVNHSCSTSHSTGGSSEVIDPVKMLARPALALHCAIRAYCRDDIQRHAPFVIVMWSDIC